MRSFYKDWSGTSSNRTGPPKLVGSSHRHHQDWPARSRLQDLTGRTIRNPVKETEIAEQKKQIKELHDRDLTTQLAVGTATEIRQRLWANYQKSKGKTSVDVKNNITAGNKAAHHSNVIVDTILTNRGLIDTHTFHELYGITHNTAKPYLGIYSSPLPILYAY